MDAHVVVVGSGYGGAAVISELEELNPGCEVTWISREPVHVVRHEMHRLLRRPELYDHLRVPVDRIRSTATRFLEATVTGVDSENQRLALDTGDEVDYDYLVLTVGCRPAFYGVPGLAEQGIPMGTIDHARKIQESVAAAIESATPNDPARICVGGAGLTGVQTVGEIATEISETEAPGDVTVIEALDHILPNEDVPLQNAVRTRLERLGVNLHTGAPIVEVDEGTITLDGETELPYDLLIWTGGITGQDFIQDSELAQQQGRLQVDETLQTSDDRIYAVGDIALAPATGGQAPPTAQAAWQAAPVAARNVLAAARGQRQEHWQFRDKGTLVSIGDAAVASGVVGMPMETVGGPLARGLKKLVAVRWLATLIGWREAFRLWRYL